MTYLPSLGSIDASKFNCTKYPGVCKPMDFVTLDLVRDMQDQLNRIAKVKGLKLIAVDGDIGPGTVALAKATGPWMMVDTSSPMGIATGADALFEAAKKVADSLNAPAKVSPPIPPKAPSIITSTGLELKAPPRAGASMLDSVKNLGMPTLLLLGVGVVGVGYYATRKGKKRK